MVMGAWISVVLAWALQSSSGVVIGMQLIAWCVTLGVLVWLWSLQRGHRREVRALDEIEDAVARKFYAESAHRLNKILSSPMRTPPNRLRALVLAGAVLGRSAMGRSGGYDEAILIYDELIDTERLAGPGGVMVRVGRAMAMLHADQLYDADRAINNLRRLIDRGGAQQEMRQFIQQQAPQEELSSSTASAVSSSAIQDDASDGESDRKSRDETRDETSPDVSSSEPFAVDPTHIAGLRLVELYRDIKTGHVDEAVGLFHTGLDVLRLGLGQRVGEAYALLAVALDRLGDNASAQQAVLDATAMQPGADLGTRYPEFASVLKKYPATPVPSY